LQRRDCNLKNIGNKFSKEQGITSEQRMIIWQATERMKYLCM
jgi:hypothetical protein